MEMARLRLAENQILVSVMEPASSRMVKNQNLVTGLASYRKQPSAIRRVKIGADPVKFLFQHVDIKTTSAFRRRKRLLQSSRPCQSASAMDSMNVTEEEILREKQILEKEEMFLGKGELPDARDSVEEASSRVGKVGSEIRECWDLWQRIGIPVQKIAKMRNMTVTGVFFCIFTCIQNDYTVDWYELCKETEFTSEIAKRLIQATEKFISNSPNGRKDGPIDMNTLRQDLPSTVSDVHFGLFVTMLSRGLSYDSILETSVQTGGDKPQSNWGEFYADEERFPSDVNEKTVLKFLSQKNGASMIDIALKFRECNDLELMRLLLKLEDSDKIFWKQGIFKAFKR